MKIHEAAKAVLVESCKPLSVKAIYDEIVRRDLFQFGAKDPVSVLASTLRKKSDVSPSNNVVIFKKKGPKIYGLAEWAE